MLRSRQIALYSLVAAAVFVGAPIALAKSDPSLSYSRGVYQRLYNKELHLVLNATSVSKYLNQLTTLTVAALGTNGAPLQGVAIKINMVLSGVTSTVASGTTDSTGAFVFSFNFTLATTYSFTATGTYTPSGGSTSTATSSPVTLSVNPATISVTTNSVLAGGTVSWSVQDDFAAAVLTVSLSGTTVGTATADSTGAASGTFTAPATAGTYSLSITDSAGNKTGVITITVTAPVALGSVSLSVA